MRACADIAQTVEDIHPNAKTILELMGLFGLGRSATKARVSALVDAGKAQRVTVHRLCSDQRRTRVSAYVLVE